MSDYGNVDLFGLDEFGAPVGIPQAIGAGVGAGAQWAGSFAIRKWTTKDKYAEGIGALVGAAAAGTMIVFQATRAAGWAALAAALVGGGLRQLEASAFPTATTAGVGLPVIQPAPVVAGLGVPINNAGTGLFGAQMGVPVLQPAPVVPMDGPPQLQNAGDYGMSANPAAQQARLVGTSPMGMANHYGGTIFG